jgi:septum site-determining protein MinC
VRGPAIHRFAERELKLKLFTNDRPAEPVARPAEPVVPVALDEIIEDRETEELDAEGAEESAPAVFAPAPIDTRAEARPRLESHTSVPMPVAPPAPVPPPPPTPLQRVTIPHDLTAAELAFGEPEPRRATAVEARPVAAGPPAMLGRPGLDTTPRVGETDPPSPRLLEPGRTQSIHRTLRSGAIIRFEGDLYVFGDVNPGAQVIATGNIVVLGALKGVAHAGANGDEAAFILSFDLRPTQLRIGRKIAVPPTKRTAGAAVSEIATVHDGQIVIEPYRASSPGGGSLASGAARRPDPTRIRS